MQGNKYENVHYKEKARILRKEKYRKLYDDMDEIIEIIKRKENP